MKDVVSAIAEPELATSRYSRLSNQVERGLGLDFCLFIYLFIYSKNEMNVYESKCVFILFSRLINAYFGRGSEFMIQMLINSIQTLYLNQILLFADLFKLIFNDKSWHLAHHPSFGGTNNNNNYIKSK